MENKYVFFVEGVGESLEEAWEDALYNADPDEIPDYEEEEE
jgi:hypothetical protein